MNESPKIIVVGAGYWGRNWIKTILNSKYKLTGIVEPKPNLLDNYTVPCYKRLSDVSKKDYTHVIVATPAKTHFEIIKMLYHLPKHNILLEKPCGTTLQQSKSFFGIYPGFVFLHDPLYQLMKLSLKGLGSVKSFSSIRASMGPKVRDDVGVILDYMIHDIAMFIDMFGFHDIDILQVITENYFAPPIKTSLANVFLKKNNISVHLMSSWWYPEKIRKIVIIGDQSSFLWKNDILKIVNEHYVLNKVESSPTCVYGRFELQKKSNLELELESFISNTKPYDNLLLLNVHDLIHRILNSKK